MFSNKPTFASAMSIFSKAQQELKEAQALNEIETLEAEEKLRACKEESSKISKVVSFFDCLLGESVVTKK